MKFTSKEIAIAFWIVFGLASLFVIKNNLAIFAYVIGVAAILLFMPK